MPSSVAQMVNVIQDIIPAGKPNRPGTALTVSFVTVHNTSNTNKGADAKAHSKFVKNTGFYVLPSGKKNFVSWHYTVDDKEVYQHLPITEKGIHAGGGNGKSIGIEICMNSDGDITAANLRAATLIAALLIDLKLKSNRIVTHKHWTGKKCPVTLLNGSSEGTKWSSFVAMVDGIMKGIGKPAGGLMMTPAAARGIKTAKTAAKTASRSRNMPSEARAEEDDVHMAIPKEFLSN